MRTFRAPSMHEALAAVKRELGADAVILGTRSLSADGLQRWARRDRVEITAAPPGCATPAPRAGKVPRPKLEHAAEERAGRPGPAPATPQKPALPQHLCRYYVELVQNEVAEELAERLVREATRTVSDDRACDDALVRRVLREYIARMIPDTPGAGLSGDGPRRVAFVGPSGSGKSTTVAKLAALFQLRHEKRVALLSIDMHRLDAHGQLQRYADALGVPVHVAQTMAEVKQALKSLDSVDLLLIDTPGVGLREQARFARMAALLRAARPDEIHLVLPAWLAPPVQSRMAQSFAPLKVSKVALTHLDEVVGLGVVLNVVDRLSLGISFMSTGQNVPNDIQEACGAQVAKLVLAADD